MQRPKLDLRRVREVAVQNLRDRAARLRNVQALGPRLTRLRRRPFRAEYLVPVAAFLLLVLALVLSYAPATPLVVDNATPSVESSAVAMTTTGPTVSPTTRGPGSGYPMATATVAISDSAITPVAQATPSLTETLATETSAGYPGPDITAGATSGPIPIGTPVAGGLPPADESLPTPSGSFVTPPFGTPPLGGSSGALATPVIPSRSGGFATPAPPRSSGNAGGGYPGPGSPSANGQGRGNTPQPPSIPTPLVPRSPGNGGRGYPGPGSPSSNIPTPGTSPGLPLIPTSRPRAAVPARPTSGPVAPPPVQPVAPPPSRRPAAPPTLAPVRITPVPSRPPTQPPPSSGAGTTPRNGYPAPGTGTGNANPPVTQPQPAQPPSAPSLPTPAPTTVNTRPAAAPTIQATPRPAPTTLAPARPAPTAAPRATTVPATQPAPARTPTSQPNQPPVAPTSVGAPTPPGTAPTTGATTSVGPTATGAPVTASPAQTTATPVPPTATPAPPTATPVPPTPTPDPVNRIEGNVRWAQAQSPIVIERDTVVVRDAALEIEPGVEVQLKPGVNLFVEGQLRAAGVEGNPVRFVGNGGRWKSITGQADSVVTLEHAELRNAGNDGVAVSSSGGKLNLRNVLLTDGGGGIVTDGSAVDIQGVQVTGNDLRTGPAANISVKPQTPVTLRGNIFGGNQLPQGTPQVRLNAGTEGSGALAIEGNVFAGGAGPLLELQTASAMSGPIRCNGFYGGTVGLQLSSSTPDANGFGLVVETNTFEQQTVYGAASTIGLGAGNNWWGDPSGPSEAQRNPEGRGVRIGVNVGFDPVLQARPECAPHP